MDEASGTPDPRHTVAPPLIEAVGSILEMPLKTIPVPVLVTAVAVRVFEPITAYFTQGNDPVYFAAAIFASVPAISPAT